MTPVRLDYIYYIISVLYSVSGQKIYQSFDLLRLADDLRCVGITPDPLSLLSSRPAKLSS